MGVPKSLRACHFSSVVALKLKLTDLEKWVFTLAVVIVPRQTAGDVV